MFKSLPNTVSVESVKDGLCFNWMRNGIDFGQLTLRAKDGKLVVDSECMSEGFCLEIIRQAFGECVFDDLNPSIDGDSPSSEEATKMMLENEDDMHQGGGQP